MSTDEIRSAFLSYFQGKGHELVASSPLVPSNDPTLLFTNAGMVQFKDVFTGIEKRGYKMATSSQKCVRAGGKHNDLENVGYTRRHHTFFEMLGNFSFGAYFKKEAIEYAWDFIINVLKLPEDRLCVTVFEGDDDVPADDEAANLWAAVGVAPARVLRLGRADNYWQMGDSGPQGPCSEIHYFMEDDFENMFAPGRVAESDGWVEIWNLVFMQFFKEKADSPLQDLPKPCVDTGAGLERLAVILQGKQSNYDADGFRAYLDAIASELNKEYKEGDSADEVSMRVIADHARATTFLVADGVQPSNLGRGYVLRRIMRRAIRHGSRLGFDDLFFHRACARVITQMKAAYPQLIEAATLIEKVAKSEETAFRRTLDKGIKLLNKEIEGEQPRALDSAFVAKLYGTFGFPIDLTRVIAEERGFSVDEDEAMRIVKSDSGQNENLGGAGAAVANIWFRVREDVGPTRFLGYEVEESRAEIIAVEAAEGGKIQIVLNQTPFYGESGGQVGDCGELSAEGLKIKILDTKKPRPDLLVHLGEVLEGQVAVGQEVIAKVDHDHRDAIRRNHSATHLLHLALKEVLGNHVQQKGSLVAADRLRFDYSHFESLTPSQLSQIETRVNELVLANAATETSECGIEEARAAGATMLFGEKYDEKVRMVRIGQDSLELCGGTHVGCAGEIGLIKVLADSAIASGIRRMEAVSGLGALAWASGQGHLLAELSGIMNSPAEMLTERVSALIKRNKGLERELEQAKAAAALGAQGGGDILDKVEEIAGIKVLVHRADGTPTKALRDVSDQLRDRLGSGVVVLGAADEDKAALLVAVTKDLLGKVHAGKLVSAATAAMEGRGGGRPDFAQGGGKSALLERGFAAARAALEEYKS